MYYKNAKIFSMYSYKGGSGRTTITANIAYNLASEGNNVLLIDADVQAPGLRLLFDIKEQSINGGKRVYFQDYVQQNDTINVSDLIVDSSQELGLNFDKGSLNIIPSTQNYNKQLDGYNYKKIRFYILEMINDFMKLNNNNDKNWIIIIDTSNGYNEPSKAVFSICDYVFIFFRYSRQHMMGTYTISDFLNRVGIKYFFIVSSEPKNISGPRRKNYDSFLTSDLDLNKSNWVKNIDEIFASRIPEYDELKWEDRILLLDNMIINKFQSGKYPDENSFFSALDKLLKKIKNLSEFYNE